MNPLLSVIVPVYNVENYIDRCVKSLLNSTYTHMEILLIDDGSTDNSGAICDKWANFSNKVKSIHIPHSGVSNARNYGLLNCTPGGGVLTFVDPDDFVEFDYFEKLLNPILSNAKVDIVIGGATQITLNKTKRVLQDFPKNTYVDKEALQLKILNPKMCENVWGKVYRKKLFNTCLFDTNMSYAEDVDMILNVISKANKIYSIPYCGYYWCERVGSACNTLPYEKQVSDYLYFLYKAVSVYKVNSVVALSYATAYYEMYYSYNNISPLTYNTADIIAKLLAVDYKYVNGKIDFLYNNISNLTETIKLEYIFIYGHGYNGKKLYDFLSSYNIKCHGFVVSDGEPANDCLTLSELLKNYASSELIIIMGMKRENNFMVLKNIYKYDLKKILI